MEYIKVQVDPVSVQEVVTEYIPSVQNLAPRTLEEYEHELGLFAHWCQTNTVMLHQVNNKTVYQFLAHLKATLIPNRKDAKEISSYTLFGYVRVIKSFLNWCFEEEQFEGQVKANTLKRIKNPIVEETIIQTFTPGDIIELFAACEKECSEQLQIRDKAIIAMLLDTGIRSSELLTLTLSHLNLDSKDNHIRVLGKGSKWGEVGLGTKSAAYINKYIKTYRIPHLKQLIPDYEHLSSTQKHRSMYHLMQNELVFLNRYGEPLTGSGLNRIITRLGEWAGIIGMRCCAHDFRHTFAVEYIRQGGDIYTLSQLLRHNDLDTTEDYLKSLKQTEARRHAKSVMDNMDL